MEKVYVIDSSGITVVEVKPDETLEILGETTTNKIPIEIEQEENNGISGFLPRGICFYQKTKNYRYVCAEITPRVINIRISGREYDIAIPYVYLLCRFDSREFLSACQIFCTQKPLISWEEKLYHLPLPNQSYGGICFGEEAEDFLLSGRASNICLKTKQLLNYYLTSNFNSEIAAVLPNDITSFKNWAEKTKADRNFILGIKLHEMSNAYNYEPLRDLRKEQK